MQVEALRRQRNELSSQAKGQKPSDEQVETGKQLKDQIVDLEHKLSSIDKEFLSLLEAVRISFRKIRRRREENAREEKKWGEPRQDDVQDHLDWGEANG